jgi:hypothetical protein
MKYLRIILWICVVSLWTGHVWAVTGNTASTEDIARLKKDLALGKIQIGITRLKDVRSKYGDASTITDTEKRITYEYGDFKIDFEKTKYWRKWEYDSFKTPAYTSDINALRKDLERRKITGDFITSTKIRRDYGEPTEIYETNDDGELSIYYYGDLKLYFENVVVVKLWKGKGLSASDALVSKENTKLEAVPKDTSKKPIAKPKAK